MAEGSQTNEHHTSRYQLLLQVCELPPTTAQPNANKRYRPTKKNCKECTLGNSTVQKHVKKGPWGKPRQHLDRRYLLQNHTSYQVSYISVPVPRWVSVNWGLLSQSDSFSVYPSNCLPD